MVQGLSGEGVENKSDSIFALRKRLVRINEQHDDFNFFFSRLDPFLVCQVNFAAKLRVLI